MTDLRHFLDPRRSKLRPYLAFLALQNDRLHKEGNLVGNNPSITWYANHLKRLNISGNYYGIRKHLWKMADAGVLQVRHVQRPVATHHAQGKRITKIPHAEFYVDEKNIPELTKTLERIFPKMPI